MVSLAVLSKWDTLDGRGSLGRPRLPFSYIFGHTHTLEEDAGAPPPGCLCLDVLEEGEGPIPSSSNVCVCPKNLPCRKVPELWGSPPRHTPRLAVPVVAPELCATVSITYCLFS